MNSRKIKKNSDRKSINLIISEIKNDKSEAIDFAEALYGTEYSTFQDQKCYLHRDNDGLFLEQNFANKVAGIIVLHRKHSTLTSEYEKILCSNPMHDYLNSISDLIDAKIIERYTKISEGFFD